jgi:hypothetical protein
MSAPASGSGAREGRFVIDAFGLTAEGLRAQDPAAYQWLLDHVKPERDQNRDAQRRRHWWLFGRSNVKLRDALRGLRRYIATPETTRRRVFQFFPLEVCPDHKLYAVASDDAFVLGVLSSRPHVLFATTAGGRLGVGNDPVSNNTRCFEPFPFPDPPAAERAAIARLAEDLDAWRKRVQAAHPDATLTALYNLRDKLRAGEKLGDKEQALHFRVGTDELRRLHDELDRAVLAAYGWRADLADDALLEKLVALNAERAAEEEAGHVRWLRPPAGAAPAAAAPAAQQGSLLADQAAGGARPPWPPAAEPVAQLAAVLGAVQAADAPLDAEAVAARFQGGRDRKKRAAEILALLAAQRLVLATGDGRYGALARPTGAEQAA